MENGSDSKLISDNGVWWMSDRESKNPRPMPICSAKKVSIRLRIVSNLVNHFLYNELYKYQKLCVSAIWYWLFQFLLNIAKPNLSLMSVEQGYGRIMMLRKWFTDFKHCYIQKVNLPIQIYWLFYETKTSYVKPFLNDRLRRRKRASNIPVF